MSSMPPPGQLSQQSGKHLDLLFALAYPQKAEKDTSTSRSNGIARVKEIPATEANDASPPPTNTEAAVAETTEEVAESS